MSDLMLIDTSIWILSLRPGSKKEVEEEVSRIIIERRAATTGMIMLELLSGVSNNKMYKELLEDLQALHYFPVAEEVWNQAFRLGHDLRTRGVTIPSADLIIASVAIHNQTTLLHTDRHFDLIAGHSPLKTMGIAYQNR